MQGLDELTLSPRLIRAIGEIDEFKGRWSALGRLAPERLSALRRVATVESVGSSTRTADQASTPVQGRHCRRSWTSPAMRSAARM